MSFHDKCAVVGVWNHPEASFLTYLALYALQHRGQEGAGIVSLHKGEHLSYKNPGSCREISLHKEKLTNFKRGMRLLVIQDIPQQDLMNSKTFSLLLVN